MMTMRMMMSYYTDELSSKELESKYDYFEI